jgi:hypothetical protein
MSFGILPGLCLSVVLFGFEHEVIGENIGRSRQMPVKKSSLAEKFILFPCKSRVTKSTELPPFS